MNEMIGPDRQRIHYYALAGAATLAIVLVILNARVAADGQSEPRDGQGEPRFGGNNQLAQEWTPENAQDTRKSAPVENATRGLPAISRDRTPIALPRHDEIPQDARSTVSPKPDHPPFSVSPTGDPVTVADAVAMIEDEAVTVTSSDALDLARKSIIRFGKGSRRDIAVAANTRGYRLLKLGQGDDALPLLLAAIKMDSTYGMPRFNAARVYAVKGESGKSLKYLKQLKAMGKRQQQRLDVARTEPDFDTLRSDPRYQALFQ